MSLKALTIKVSLKWIKEDTTCLECISCEDIIYSDTYRLNFNVNNKVSETKLVICESCYDIVK